MNAYITSTPPSFFILPKNPLVQESRRVNLLFTFGNYHPIDHLSRPFSAMFTQCERAPRAPRGSRLEGQARGWMHPASIYLNFKIGHRSPHHTRHTDIHTSLLAETSYLNLETSYRISFLHSPLSMARQFLQWPSLPVCPHNHRRCP